MTSTLNLLSPPLSDRALKSGPAQGLTSSSNFRMGEISSNDSGPRSFPFSAIVGQEQMKLALMIAAVDPSVGGVLVLGDRGTGKSTAVRALAKLLPLIEVVAGCPYGCDPSQPAAVCESCARELSGPRARTCSVPVPMVDLPLGSTEDRLLGALDLERALVAGEKSFEPGLLARANRGFLYIDEVNLLEDHLVDLLIDVAASGVNVVERDGLSVRHPARFVLVGSGNPEEGELRPQLLDRFGLCVEVKTPDDIPSRVDIVRRRDAFERDPAKFVAMWAAEEARIRRQIVSARENFASVSVPDAILEQAARLCIAIGTDGLRGELTLVRAARAIASLNGDSDVDTTHLRQISAACLRHRLRRAPLDETGSQARVQRMIVEHLGA